MKKALLPFLLSFACLSYGQDGHEIKVTFKPFKNTYIYLGHYFGKTYPVIDSVKLDENSTGVFRGEKKLPGGIYLIGYPDKAGFFEFLVDKQQHFSVIADTSTMMNGVRFENSPDNVLFSAYQQQISQRGRSMQRLQQEYQQATNAADSARIAAEISKIDREIRQERDEIIQNHPQSLLSALLICMREPQLTGRLKNPQTRADSTEAYFNYKQQYWEGVNFWDGRLAYTPFFEEKLDKYYSQLVALHPDSVIKEIDWMMGYASANEEMTRFLLIKFVNRYLNQKYMWEDAVFVHLFEKYFALKDYKWLTEAGKKMITDRAYNLIYNITGKAAPDIVLPDSTGKNIRLYDVKAENLILVFWDPTCGHCKELLPRLDSLYRSSWKKAGVGFYAVAKESSGTKKDWLQYIGDHKISDWTHVYYSKSHEKDRVDSGIPGYSQLFDIQTFPTLYLLDKDKRIRAKKLSFEQINDILELKNPNH